MGTVMLCLEAGEWIFDSLIASVGVSSRASSTRAGVSPGRAQSQLEVPENSSILSQAVG